MLAVGLIPPDVENSMLHFSDTLIICSYLLLFVFLLALTEEGILVTLRKAEHPYVKNGTVLVSSPEHCQLQCLDGLHPPCLLIQV